MLSSKTAGGILTKFWYPGMSVCIKSGRRLQLYLFSCLGKIQAMTHGFASFLLLLGLAVAVAVVLAVAKVVFLCPSLQIMMKIKILNSIKTKSTLSFCGKSL